MNTYTKVLLEHEVIAIREALIEYKHFLNKSKPKSDAAIRHKKSVSALVDDFKNTIK